MDASPYSFTGSRDTDELIFKTLGDNSDSFDVAVVVLDSALSAQDGIILTRGMNAARMFGRSQAILQMIAKNQRIQAIKAVRTNSTITGLKEAKDIVDAVAAAMKIGDRLKAAARRIDNQPTSAASSTMATSHPAAFRYHGNPSPGFGQPSRAWPKPEPAVDLTAEFANQLRIARRRAGEPSLNRLANIDNVASKATLSRAFKGERLPSWGVVEMLLDTFGVPREEIGGLWRRRWLLALEQHQPVGLHDDRDPFGEQPAPPPQTLTETETPTPEHPAAAPGGQMCTACGAWVVDLTRHQAWHWDLDQRIRQNITSPGENGTDA
ncbi:ribosomal protein L7/L12 [Actinomadura sp. 9N215]|uniref:ribosomal protein L7/L12 n=1 Tax=Actinomadura sp. 9N215 TaxID=3375150 RepID=UPI0037945609